MEPELRDIHLPELISWWPPAPGWWIVAILTLFSLLFTLWWILRPTSRRKALKILKTIEKDYYTTGDSTACVRHLSALLRRVAISHNRTNAGLTGPEWLRALDERLKSTEFSSGIGQIILTAPYQPSVASTDIPELLSLCRRLIQSKPKPHPKKNSTILEGK